LRGCSRYYSIYPDNNYNAGINPWPHLRAVESNVCGGSTPPQTTKYWVDTFANATGYSSQGGTATGTLNAGTNYVFCKKWGPEVRVGTQFNHYWMLTDLDSGNPGKISMSRPTTCPAGATTRPEITTAPCSPTAPERILRRIADDACS
jgi:hypothetical protein